MKPQVLALSRVLWWVRADIPSVSFVDGALGVLEFETIESPMVTLCIEQNDAKVAPKRFVDCILTLSLLLLVCFRSLCCLGSTGSTDWLSGKLEHCQALATNRKRACLSSTPWHNWTTYANSQSKSLNILNLILVIDLCSLYSVPHAGAEAPGTWPPHQNFQLWATVVLSNRKQFVQALPLLGLGSCPSSAACSSSAYPSLAYLNTGHWDGKHPSFTYFLCPQQHFTMVQWRTHHWHTHHGQTHHRHAQRHSHATHA